jgi:hypothetical protein
MNSTTKPRSKKTDEEFARKLNQVVLIHSLLKDFVNYLSVADCLTPQFKFLHKHEEVVMDFIKNFVIKTDD